ncbi:hypothetical protein [Tenacibaculum dicentrarchi]|uniref:hypothetical protein n=1 Tax=Tenacibaculum dicentrarchi TaxID=669041 RepID=UPI000C7B6901|nr:hypothetical protein TDCHD05_40003 [Tenacibaculum dicentrarchi]
METVVIIIGVLGSIASLYGAYLSIEAKNKSKASATIAEKAKNEVLKKQKTTYLANILFEAKRVQQAFGKYSIAQSNRSLVGVEFSKDSESLQSFIFNFNENRATIEDTTEIETNLAYTELNKLLSDFSSANNTNKIDFGKQIRFNIDDIIFKIKRTIDNRNENAD